MALITPLALSPDNPLPAWALSGGPLVFQQLDGSSGAVLSAALIAALLAAGWVETATLSTGATLQATSPQSLTVLLDVTWLTYAGTDYVGVQLHGTATGYQHYVGCAAARTFQIVAGPCQGFLSQPGVAGPASYGSNIAFGIPYLAPTDPVYPDGALPDECWWSNGDKWPSGTSNSFRNNLGYVDDNQPAWCAYFHRPGESTTHSLALQHGAVALMCVEMSFGAGVPTQMIYPQLEPFALEPLLAWGDWCAAGYVYPAGFVGFPPKVRGQLYDAMILSGPQIGNATPGGSEQLVQLYGDKSMWLNFSFGLPLANLMLLLPGGESSAVGNVAY